MFVELIAIDENAALFETCNKSPQPITVDTIFEFASIETWHGLIKYLHQYGRLPLFEDWDVWRGGNEWTFAAKNRGSLGADRIPFPYEKMLTGNCCEALSTNSDFSSIEYWADPDDMPSPNDSQCGAHIRDIVAASNATKMLLQLIAIQTGKYDNFISQGLLDRITYLPLKNSGFQIALMNISDTLSLLHRWSNWGDHIAIVDNVHGIADIEDIRADLEKLYPLAEGYYIVFATLCCKNDFDKIQVVRSNANFLAGWIFEGMIKNKNIYNSSIRLFSDNVFALYEAGFPLMIRELALNDAIGLCAECGSPFYSGKSRGKQRRFCKDSCKTDSTNNRVQTAQSMYYVQGKSVKEIAAKLDRSESKIQSWIDRLQNTPKKDPS